MIADPIPRALPWARWCCPFGALCARAALPIHWLVKSTTPKTGVPLGTRHKRKNPKNVAVPKGTPIIIFAMLYQPMNWLAIQIPSLRDFTRQCRLTRCKAALHDAKRPYTAALPPYTPAGPYTTRSVLTRPKGLTRCEAALLVPKAPYTARQRLSTRQRRPTARR